MNIAPILSNPMVYQLPQTARDTDGDERTESAATRAREAETGKEASVATSTAGRVNLTV